MVKNSSAALRDQILDQTAIPSRQGIWFNRRVHALHVRPQYHIPASLPLSTHYDPGSVLAPTRCHSPITMNACKSKRSKSAR